MLKVKFAYNVYKIVYKDFAWLVDLIKLYYLVIDSETLYILLAMKMALANTGLQGFRLCISLRILLLFVYLHKIKENISSWAFCCWRTYFEDITTRGADRLISEVTIFHIP